MDPSTGALLHARDAPEPRGGPVLIVLSGLPGTGKSTVAAALAARLGAVHLSVDPIEDALLAAGLPRSWETGVAAYEAAGVMARQNLWLGTAVVVDAVNDSEPARDTWRRAAAGARAGLVFVLLALDDVAEHRRRLAGRTRPLTHVPEPTWADVLARAAASAPWAEASVVRLDASRPVDDVVLRLAALLADRPRSGRGG